MSEQIGTIIDSGITEPSSNPTRAIGTPRGNAQPEIINGFDAIEPDTERITAPGGDSPRRTKRGGIDRRTRAGRTATGEPAPETKESVHLSKLDLAEVLLTVHLTLSEFTKVPELELERDEAEQLADASKELAKFYNVSFDPKKVALFNFCLALGKVYVPRAIIIKKRMEKEARPVQLKEVPKQQASEQPKSKVNGAPAPMPFIPPIDPVEMLGGAADME